jgi:Ulp1 family protease
MMQDARFFSEWSGAVEPILLDWCNEAHDINRDGSVGRFLNLDIKVIEQMWDNVFFALQDEHITENTELAHVFPNINKNNVNVLYGQDVRMVQKDSFMGNNQLNFFASSAIQQIHYFVLGTIKRFHTLECGFMNHLYYHRPNVRNVYRYNSVRRWVKDINLLDYDYVYIPTDNNELHWVMFIIVPAERRVKCYVSLYDADGFHYESLSVIIKFLKDYQVLNKLPVDDWTWSVKKKSEPKQNNGIDCGVFVCMLMYCTMKGLDMNSIPVDAYNIRLRLFIVCSMLKWDIGTEDYSFSRMPQPQDNACRLPYDGDTHIFY